MFTGSVTYDTATVRKMEKVRYRTFNLPVAAARILCGVVMVVCGYFTGGTAGVLLVAFGCIITVSHDVTGRWRTDQTVKALGGGIIKVRYEFDGEGFTTITESPGAQPQKCAYQELIVLMEDSRFFYLYPNEYQVYLIAVDSIAAGDREAFKAHLSEKTGLTWIKPLSLLTANLKTIIQFQKAVSAGKKKQEQTRKTL